MGWWSKPMSNGDENNISTNKLRNTQGNIMSTCQAFNVSQRIWIPAKRKKLAQLCNPTAKGSSKVPCKMCLQISRNMQGIARYDKEWHGIEWQVLFWVHCFSARNAFGPQSCNTVFPRSPPTGSCWFRWPNQICSKEARKFRLWRRSIWCQKSFHPLGTLDDLEPASHLSGVTWKSWTTDHSWRSMKIKNDQFGPCYQDLAMTSNSDQRPSTTHNDKQWQARTGWLVMINDYQPPSMTISVLNLAWLLKADLVPCLLPSLQRWARLRRCSSSQGSQKWRHWAQSKHSEGSQVLMHSSQRQ